MLVAARSESGRSNATPHGLPQQPNDPISRFCSAGDGQQEEHSAWTDPESSVRPRTNSPNARSPTFRLGHLVST
jgi:hypothetical protein